MKVTITSTQVQEKSWRKDNRSGVIRTQQAIAECPKFRQSIKLDLGSADAYPVGEYNCDLEDSLNVNQFGDLKLGRLVLVNAKPSIAAAPAAKSA
ncbi:hypothetical protein OK348_12170 [Flavobacterium sp. MXW15]|uniref:Single-stranded DNA-binding protein n=1 Tax=Xanthomonas chitinilytica TaxID=2989819 RepID=A0ABT3JY13_9XANT|nr:single-stranded DNA-binding protein [Xanthomonas sp. H13-6]MCW4455542.1 hypothetical protein [Flavobacterium sp. MXW15]MCW4473377.1 hypothetical protein [Xanthomonas sp. H13-6]